MLNKIDKLTETEFTEVFGNIFEDASWIAVRLYKQKPFYNFNNLCEKIISIFEESDIESKLKILNSHPDLADKAKIGSLTLDSNNEQNDAGLNQCTEKEFNDFKNLNLEYKNKFGFPFIIAVKGKKKEEILENFKQRFANDANREFNEAKEQVKKIATFRLNKIIN